MPCSPSEKCHQYTLYAEPLKSVPVVLHTHLFIAAPATVVKREAQCVYVTYSSVRAWMDGSQTEVKEQEREMQRSKKQRNRCCANVEAQRYKRVFFFYLLPFASDVLNNCYEGFKCLLRPLPEIERRGNKSVSWL